MKTIEFCRKNYSSLYYLHLLCTMSCIFINMVGSIDIIVGSINIKELKIYSLNAGSTRNFSNFVLR